MSESAPGSPGARTPTPTDEQFAEAFANGYGEGLREALHEILAHASRGHTTQELRFLIQSRLARVGEDVEVKRRSLLSPPRRTSWGARPRGTAPEIWGAPRASAPTLSSLLVSPGQAYLILEERPQGALEFVAEHQERFARLVAVGPRPPEHPSIAAARWTYVPIGPPGASGGTTGTLDLAGAAGRIRAATEAEGSTLLYLEAVEYLVTEYGLDTTFRFVNFLTGQVQHTASVLVVSEDPHALPSTEQSRLQRLFNIVR